VIVNCVVKEHNTMFAARAHIPTARSAVEHTIQGATAPPIQPRQFGNKKNAVSL